MRLRRLGVESLPNRYCYVNDNIANDVAAFSRLPDGGLIVATGARVILHRDLIIKLAAQHRLPAIFPDRNFCQRREALLSLWSRYGSCLLGNSDYVDRILRGAKPSDLPVHEPTKY